MGDERDALIPRLPPPGRVALGEAELAGVLATAARLQATPVPDAAMIDRATAELAAAARLDAATLTRARADHRLGRGLAGLTSADRRWFALKRFVAGLPGTLVPRPTPGDDGDAARLAAHVLAGRAQAVRKEGNPRLGVWLAHRALARDPSCYKAWYELGIALERLHRPEEACDAYRVAIEHGLAEPLADDPFALSGALNNLAILVEGAVGDDVAEAMYRKALEVRPSNGIAAYNLALLYKARGRYADALACLALAKAVRPDDQDVAKEIGIVEAARANPL